MKITNRKIALNLWASGNFCFAVLPGYAQNTTPVEAPAVCQQLRSPNLREREKAALSVMAQWRQAEKCLIQELDDLRQKPVAELRKFDGP